MNPFKHLDKIPEFYRNRHNNNLNENFVKLKEQTRLSLLNQLIKENVSNNELQELWSLLEKTVQNSNQNSNLPSSNSQQQMINYLQFKQIDQQLSDSKLKKFFTPTLYQQLLNEHQQQNKKLSGKISIIKLYHYIIRKLWLRQSFISLSLFDSNGSGYLTGLELENYIRQLLPTLTKLNNMNRSYYPFYICIVTRKFFFLLDPYKHNRIRIIDILFSGLLDDLFQLQINNNDGQTINNDFNWFSSTNTIRLYNIYVDLDDDHNGMISKSEFKKFGNFNELFIEQLFDVCMTYNKEIDFKTFIDIILALENRKEIQSIYFFFTILDIKHCNYLDEFVLKYFFKAIEKQMYCHGQEPISFVDFSNEIYDMIRPNNNRKFIYFDDLVNCGHADTIINILIDFNGFYAYENRDSNILRLRNQ